MGSDAAREQNRASPFQPPRPLSRHSRRSTINNNNNESVTVFQTKIVLSGPPGPQGGATLSVPDLISQPGPAGLSPKVFLQPTLATPKVENQGSDSQDPHDHIVVPNEPGRPSPVPTPVPTAAPREQSPTPVAQC